MGIVVVDVDDSFKRPGNIPFSWEIRPGVPKTRIQNPNHHHHHNINTSLQPPKKLSPLRLKPLSHSQPLLPAPPMLSPPSSSFIHNSKSRPLSPLTPSFSTTTPLKLKPLPPASGLYSPAPSFRSSPRAFSERWQLHRLNRVRDEVKPVFDVGGIGCFPKLRKKKKSGGRRKTGVRSECEYGSDVETMSPWTVSSRRSISPMWDSPKSSFSSLRFSPRVVNEAEGVGFGFF